MAQAGDLLQRIPEFSATTRTIRIAPDISVPVTPRLLRLIDSRTFQRLRKIRQLSLSDQVYPSATHTRFSHALGVYFHVLCYLRQLDGFAEFHEIYDERDYLAVLLAGLLHDLGHYPCSHQLDHLAPFPKHEDLTIALIRGEMRIEGEDLSALIQQHFGLAPDEITVYLGSAPITEPHRLLLKQIIDSPLDADKCDYLPRDSYYCGVDFVAGFDRKRFIEQLVPVGPQLGIREKGLMGAERFQLARYWMYRSVYWGHTVRALITMLSEACKFLAPQGDADWTASLLRFNDHNFLEWLHHHVEGPGRELITMVHYERRPYKRLRTFSVHHEPEHYRKLQGADLRGAIVEKLRDWSAGKGVPLAPHHLIWDVPPSYKTETWETFPVRLANGSAVPIAEESPVIEALSQAFLHGVRKIRLFCHPRFAELVPTNTSPMPDLTEMIRRWP